MTQAPHLIGTLESALYAEDLAAAVAFWTGIIGLQQIGHVPGRHVFFRCGAQILLVFDPRATRVPPGPEARLPVPPHGAEGAGHFCMAAAPDDIERWKVHLERKGVGIEADLRWPQGGRSIYFRDPAGNSVEIADPAIWLSR
ncbi:glyoxalase/bleomycin resistance/extradiol dioxygenase family protein [Paracoccus limosus]|jgi:catechol 2,3-dioxygenase-like lactoylglutathione lyase family enzyme|uniref:Glyoxalase/bleomycin resistance/extradiol dioxygenase family protein n=1 Tax=Paracoccus limosus TaxID=913252 RepID=A0A844H7C8_9RHOB|nr:VOC family protein [Paracoccus limosus]MTH35584.1 glyoxalase/bleomycin resistance/extradiol dioxygenase family protein [Paracoccus limosus]